TLKRVGGDDIMAKARYSQITNLLRNGNDTFAVLTTTVADLGADDTKGVTKALAAAAAKVEDILKAAPAGAGRDQMHEAFASIRNQEMQFRLTGAQAARDAVDAQITALTGSESLMLMPGDVREPLMSALAEYQKKVKRWADDIAAIRIHSMEIDAKF